jgi:hypothetical protein
MPQDNLPRPPKWAFSKIRHAVDCSLNLVQLQKKIIGGIEFSRAYCPSCKQFKLLKVEALPVSETLCQSD